MSPPATGVFSCTAWCWGVLVYYSPLAGLSSICMCSHTHTIRTSGYTGINSYTGWKEWLEGKMNVKLYKYDVLDQERKVKGIARIMKKMVWMISWILQVPGHLHGVVAPALHAQPAVWQLLKVQHLYDCVPCLLPSSGDHLLVLVLLHQVCSYRLSCLWGTG